MRSVPLGSLAAHLRRGGIKRLLRSKLYSIDAATTPLEVSPSLPPRAQSSVFLARDSTLAVQTLGGVGENCNNVVLTVRHNRHLAGRPINIQRVSTCNAHLEPGWYRTIIAHSPPGTLANVLQ